jgi:hypothetical protein
MKVQVPSLVRNLKKKMGKKPFDSRCRAMRVEVVLKDMGVGENGAKTCVA